MEKDELNENIDKALYNINESIKLHKEQNLMLAKLYVGMIQKKHGDIDVLLAKPRSYSGNFRTDFKTSAWDVKDNRYTHAYFNREVRNKIKGVKAILIAKNKGLVAELKDDVFLELLGARERVIFKGKDRESGVEINTPGIPGKKVD